MVKTRTQNGVVIKPPASRALHDKDYEIDDDYEQESSDEETGKKKRKSRKTNATPKAKRQKTTTSPSKPKAANKGTAAKGGRRRKTLSLLPTMPLDVLYEIFSHLSPKDLINLSRTSTAFEKTMSDPRNATIWIAARNVLDAPDPAKGFTEAEWGVLLFDNTCESCGAKNVQDVDWNILKRTCSGCKLSHLLGSKDRQFTRTFVGYPIETFECLPNTNIRPWTRETYDPEYHLRKMYWTPDVQKLFKEWKTRITAAKSSPEAREAFNTWKKERKAIVQANTGMATTYKEWYENYIRDKGDEKYEGTKRRLEAAKLRLLNEGYSKVDIDNAIFTYTDGIRTGTPNISNAAWTRIRPKLEPLVVIEKNRRRAREMNSLIVKRMAILREVYNQHLSQRMPSEHYLCPPVEFLRPFDDVVAILEAKPDVNVTPESFDAVILKFDECIAKYQSDKRNAVFESIPSYIRPARLEDAFNLARFVFRCETGMPVTRWVTAGASHQTLIGWPMVANEPCIVQRGLQLRPGVMVDRPCRFDYYDKASDISYRLITLAGLDPKTTTIAEMDARDPRFALVKKWMDGKWTDTYQVYSWRAALYYVFDSYRSHDVWQAPEFRLATAEETETARRHTATVRETAEAWSCNHCHELFETWTCKGEAKSVIFQHLRDHHDISDPNLSVDFVMNPRCWTLLEAPCKVPLPVSSPQCFKCLKCPYGSPQRFDLDGARNHFQTGHHTADANPGRWTFIVDREMIVGME